MCEEPVLSPEHYQEWLKKQQKWVRGVGLNPTDILNDSLCSRAKMYPLELYLSGKVEAGPLCRDSSVDSILPFD